MPKYAITEHEYSLNGGTTWTTCTNLMDNGDGTGTIPVGDIALAIGTLKVRVKASGSRPAGAILSNTTAFTIAQSGGTDKVNIVVEGNSIAEGTVNYRWADIMTAHLPNDRDYDVTNVALSGRGMTQIIANAPTVDALYDETAAFNILILQEGTNSLQQNSYFAANYLDEVVSYTNARKAVGWLIVNMTVPPRTSGDPVPNDQAQSINSVFRSNTWNGTTPLHSALIDLGNNATVGAFGDTSMYPNGQHSSFSSADPNVYFDGMHPVLIGHEIIGLMAKDAVAYIVDAIPIPDQSAYPDIPDTTPVMQFGDNYEVDISNPGEVIANAVGQAVAYARGALEITAGVGLRAVVKATPRNLVPPGIYGISRNAIGSNYGWTKASLYLNSNTLYQDGLSIDSGALVGGWSNTTELMWKVWGTSAGNGDPVNCIEFYRAGNLMFTSTLAPVFPCFAGFTLEGGYSAAGWKNCKMEVFA